MDYLDPAILCCEAVEPRLGSVRRAIVDDDDLDGDVLLPEDRANRSRKKMEAIVGRDHDGHVCRHRASLIAQAAERTKFLGYSENQWYQHLLISLMNRIWGANLI